MRLSTRYTVVPLDAASVSMGLSGRTKCDTSAMSGLTSQKNMVGIEQRRDHLRTPASIFPLGKTRACKASSIS